VTCLRLERVRFAPNEATFFWTALRRAGQGLHACSSTCWTGTAQMIGQHDGQPFGGEYPTSLWEAGERVRDARAFEPAAGRAAHVRIGWYDASDRPAPAGLYARWPTLAG
jgi:hypothetical protein